MFSTAGTGNQYLAPAIDRLFGLEHNGAETPAGTKAPSWSSYPARYACI
jgi:hypothetical protein